MSSPLFQYTPAESLYNPNLGVGRVASGDPSVDELLDGPRFDENLNEWPKVTRIIQRGSLIVIEASTLTGTALLRFDPESIEGDYLIRNEKLTPQTPHEKGRILRVRVLSELINHKYFKMLNPFKYRYAVRTIPSTRPMRELIWRIGFDEFTQTIDVDLDCPNYSFKTLTPTP